MGRRICDYNTGGADSSGYVPHACLCSSGLECDWILCLKIIGGKSVDFTVETYREAVVTFCMVLQFISEGNR